MINESLQKNWAFPVKELLGCAAVRFLKLVWKNYLTQHPGAKGEDPELVCMQFPRWVMHENVPSVPMGVGRFPSLVMLDLLQIWNVPRVRFRVVLQPGSSFNVASLRVSHAYVPLKLFSAMTPIMSPYTGTMAQDTLWGGGTVPAPFLLSVFHGVLFPDVAPTPLSQLPL